MRFSVKVGLAICVVVITFFLLYSWERKAPSVFENSWQQYKELFVEDGRVIDTGNQNISHSEGQGYGLLFAVEANDEKGFEALWRWTQSTLQRSDKLFSWKYVPCARHDASCVTDPNNATDGDILIAWALLLAAQKWHNEEYKLASDGILSVVEQKLIKRAEGYTLLLPGEYGFVNSDGSIQINLSYWVFPALLAFSEITGNPVWSQLYRSGTALLDKARFGQWTLPSDWVIFNDGEFSLAEALSAEYGYNAVRIPIYLVMADDEQTPLLTPFLAFWKQAEVPATVNLQDGSVAPYSYTEGMRAIALATQSYTHSRGKETLNLPIVSAKTDYYSASLILLALMSLSAESHY
ncbi:glycosyl hydrolase family 8 [Paraglaciecola chathamensis]|uniref:glycosyl hydrolase family 8 n=1 Tax=Paraglaciecola chathamensis TaxID=368405 RepID=UPI00270132CD|nr:glycosyl hydrolase family 8 [Paraglaciecola chathamensis]MDO6560223.1 glycosyl hydrolase family 8 [Paraglaciecola chathamensis]